MAETTASLSINFSEISKTNKTILKWLSWLTIIGNILQGLKLWL